MERNEKVMEKINIKMDELPYAMEEALNRLRINIKFIDPDIKKILIVSSLPEEGKSTVSINLWKTLAEAGFPSVLVDVDLRKSEFKTRHWEDYEKEKNGINHYLSGLASLEDVLYETNIENGYVVPVADLLINPANLLESAKLDDLLDRLAEKFRYVIIDSPPLENVSDASLLASKADGAILVIRAGTTPKRLIKHSLQQLDRSNCPLLGTVLNRVKSRIGSYKGYYSKYYYGKEETKD